MLRQNLIFLGKQVWRSRWLWNVASVYLIFRIVLLPLFQKNSPNPPYGSYIILLIFAPLFAASLFEDFKVFRLRRNGVYPKRGEATMADVQRLLQSGKRILAMRCYRELYPGVSLVEAKRAIEAL
jgi:hypothetical protein